VWARLAKTSLDAAADVAEARLCGEEDRQASETFYDIVLQTRRRPNWLLSRIRSISILEIIRGRGDKPKTYFGS
jgi:hypothetical protein